jgi:hypothetical protein
VVDKWLRTIIVACDLGIALCFLLIPIGLQRRFRRKQIGYVLDGWFNGISALLVVAACYLGRL